MKKDITFIIQGPVYPEITNRTLLSVRKFFPDAQIIYSTCNLENTDILENCDRIIISDDPGSFTYADRPGEKVNNINRQIISTLAGLKVCKTKYAMKLRSDFILTGNAFLQFWDEFSNFDNKYQVFEHKLLACSYFARNPSSDMPFPFHPSDLAFFGYTTDLINFFDIALMTKDQAYWNLKDRHQYQYVPEQYLFINCLRKNGFEIKCNFYNDCTPENIEQTERFFASNFIFLTFDQFNLQPSKPTFSIKVHPNAFKSCYTHIEWQNLYKKYVDNSYIIPRKDLEQLKIEKMYHNYRKYRFFSNLCALPFRNKAKRREIRNNVLEFFLNK